MHVKLSTRVSCLSAAVATLVVASIALISARPAASVQHENPAPRSRWDAFRADVTIRQRRVDRDGSPVGANRPAVSYHVERTRDGNVWRTSMTLLDVEAPVVTARGGEVRLDSPFAIARIEMDADGEAPRLYNRKGAIVTLPTQADMQRLGMASGQRPAGFPHPAAAQSPWSSVRDWTTAIVAVPEERGQRRAALVKAYGPATRHVSGLDRHAVLQGDELSELLVDPIEALPVEITVAKNARVVSHTEISYAPYAGGVLARRHMHHERATDDAIEGRTIIDVAFDNIAVDVRRAR
jgi:hypothetical protein